MTSTEQSEQEVLDRITEGAIRAINNNLIVATRGVFFPSMIAIMKGNVYCEAAGLIAQQQGEVDVKEADVKIEIDRVVTEHLDVITKTGLINDKFIDEIVDACVGPILEGIKSFEIDRNHRTLQSQQK